MKTERLITLLSETSGGSEVFIRSHDGEISTAASISMEEHDFVLGQPSKPCIVINAGFLFKEAHRGIPAEMLRQSFWQKNYAIPWVISIISLAVSFTAIVKLLMT